MRLSVAGLDTASVPATKLVHVGSGQCASAAGSEPHIGQRIPQTVLPRPVLIPVAAAGAEGVVLRAGQAGSRGRRTVYSAGTEIGQAGRQAGRVCSQGRTQCGCASGLCRCSAGGAGAARQRRRRRRRTCSRVPKKVAAAASASPSPSSSYRAVKPGTCMRWHRRGVAYLLHAVGCCRWAGYTDTGAAQLKKGREQRLHPSTVGTPSACVPQLPRGTCAMCVLACRPGSGSRPSTSGRKKAGLSKKWAHSARARGQGHRT